MSCIEITHCCINGVRDMHGHGDGNEGATLYHLLPMIDGFDKE